VRLKTSQIPQEHGFQRDFGTPPALRQATLGWCHTHPGAALTLMETVMKTLISAAACAVLLPFTALAQASGFADALAQLEGQWDGRLEYIDYTTGEPDSIPHSRHITLAPDRSYGLQIMTFIDTDTTVYDAELVMFDDAVSTWYHWSRAQRDGSPRYPATRLTRANPPRRATPGPMRAIRSRKSKRSVLSQVWPGACAMRCA